MLRMFTVLAVVLSLLLCQVGVGIASYRGYGFFGTTTGRSLRTGSPGGPGVLGGGPGVGK